MALKAIAGGALTGLGAGMVSNAEQKRKEALERARELARQREQQDQREWQERQVRSTMVGEDGNVRGITGSGEVRDLGFRASDRASTGQTRDREVRRDMLLAAGVSDEEANLIAAGGAPNPNTVANIYERLLRDAYSPEDIAEADERMSRIFGDGWEAMVRRPGRAASGGQQSDRAASRPQRRGKTNIGSFIDEEGGLRREGGDLPMFPTDRSKLRPGQRYRFPNGEIGEWDGRQVKMIR